MTPLLDRIPMRREVDGNRVTFIGSSTGYPVEAELEDAIKGLADELRDEDDE